jgi:hypothetical protein
VLHDQSFADDISIMSSSPALAQETIDVIVRFLDWYYLQANPKKCITMAMKKFDSRNEHKTDFERYASTVYCPYDPQLNIAGTKLKFIIDIAADPNSLQHNHFKELGRFISVDLKEDQMKTEIRRRLNSDMELIDGCGVNGLCKLFLYEHFAVRRLSWVFLVHDLNLYFAKELEKRTVPRLKVWAGIFRGCDLGALFRKREHLGLQITSLVYHYQRMQLVKCCLLENSNDKTVRAIYESKKTRVMSFARRWSAAQERVQLDNAVEHETRFGSQRNNSGLGSGNYIAKPSVKEIRKKVSTTLGSQLEDDHVRHASCLTRQGVWTHWDRVLPFDLSWPNLIYGPGPRVIAFVLNAQINSVRTPDMLKLWGYAQTATCSLCGNMQCTLHHLLVNCPFALNQGRYTWRHDSVLLDIERALMNLVPSFNSRKVSCFGEIAKKEFKSSFVRAGEKKASSGEKHRPQLLDYANDWKIQVDFEDRKLVFPPIICSTNLRPDAVLWSCLSRTVILLELTCCAEEGIQGAQTRKEARYSDLMQEITEQNWTPTLLTLEVGARGLVGSRTFHAFHRIGFSCRQAKTLCKSLSEIAARCSYAIYLAHSSNVWPHNNDLVLGKNSSPAKENMDAPVRVMKKESRVEPNIQKLRSEGIKALYHFTD